MSRVATHQAPAASPDRPAGTGLPTNPSDSDSNANTTPHMQNSVLVLMMIHEIGWNRGVPDNWSIRNPVRHFLCFGLRLKAMTMAMTARMFPTTELTADTMSVHFMSTSFPCRQNYNNTIIKDMQVVKGRIAGTAHLRGDNRKVRPNKSISDQ